MSSSVVGSCSTPRPVTGVIQFAHPLATIGIVFGIWFVWAASEGTPLPWPQLLDPIKSFGLIVFRSELVMRGVFWAAIAAHVYEGVLGGMFAWKVKAEAAFVAFWTVQTFVVGFPSLKLIKAQRKAQVSAAAKAKDSKKQ